jgi:hypothetical protein
MIGKMRPKSSNDWKSLLSLAACWLLPIAATQAAEPRFAAHMRETPGYAFLTADHNLCRITKYDAEGKPFWVYDQQVKPIDVWAMPDGTVLIAYLPSPLTANKGGVRLVDADKKTVFDLAFDDEIMSVQPLDNGNFLMAECHYGRITEMDRKGNRIRSFNVATPPSGHKTVRQIRLTPRGTVLAAECYSHKLREYDFAGKVLREFDLRFVYYPEPLPDGHILAACWNHPEAQVVELDAEGKIFWNVKAAELPKEMGVMHIAGVTRLPNGNTLVSTSVKAGQAPNPRAMLFEITPDKQIVWQMLDRDGSTWLTEVRLLGQITPATESSSRSSAGSAPASTASAPSADWTFNGAAEGLSAVGGALRFVGAAAVPGADGQAVALGVAAQDADHLTAPPSDATQLGADYTIEAWIHPTRLAGWNRIVLKWGASEQYAYHLALHEGRASFLHGQADGTYVACEGGSVEPDRWQQVVGVADGAAKSLKLYLDGRLMATVPFDGTAAAAAAEPLAIGDSATLSHKDCRFVGYLDSVTLWKQPLTEEEIAARFAAHPKSPPPPPIALSAPGEILFAERHPGRDYASHYYANFGYDCGDENYWLHGADGGRLAIFNPATREVRTLIEDPKGAFRDPCIHYDGTKALFSYRKGGTHCYNLYEINLDGTGLKQITSGDWDDIEPCYLPDGDIVFCSTRCKRYVLCWLAPVAILHRCHPDGSGIRAISSGAVTENTPAVLPDGRLLYTRWEYNHRATTSFHQLWVMNPDGTGAAAYYGNMHPTGAAYIDAKPIPGTDRVVFVNSGHGANEHTGPLVLLRLVNGPDDLSQVRAFTGDGFRDPYPISATEFLAARGNELVSVTDQGRVKSLWKSGLMAHEPRLIGPRPREPLIPSRVDPSKTSGTLFLSSVYVGRNMDGLAPGAIRKLLVMEQLPKPANYHGGGSTPLAHGGKWTINRILGTVPVEADGSANFEVPAGRSIYLAALDKNDLSVKQMRSFLTVMPGERASCIGCHENRTMTYSAPGTPLAGRRAPSRIEPIAGVPEIMDFPRDIQPILDRHCVSCHGPDKRDGGVTLAGDRGPTYSLSYYNLLLYRQIKDTAGIHWKGERNQSGEPLGNDAPYEAFSSAAPLMKKLDGSHYDAKPSDHDRTMVRLWLDSATPYAGTYAAYGTGQIGGWWRLNEPTREMADAWPSTPPARDAMQRRCAACHENRMPKFVTDNSVDAGAYWKDLEGFQRNTSRFSRHHIFNLTQPEKSLALMAPLAKSAGGEAEGELPPAKPVAADWAEAPKPFAHAVVFADKADPDYQKILAHLQAAKARLDEIKRFDMPGFQPRYEYLREMKRYGVLPPDFDLKNPPKVDPYELDREYWQQFWPRAINPTGREHVSR